jgi:cholesterol transport system auxiliary component
MKAEPKRHRWHRAGRSLVALLLGALALVGCSGWPTAPVSEPNQHVLAAAPPSKAASARRDLVLEVGVPRASPGFDTPRMAYVRKPYELDYFADNRWADTPARMLAPLLTGALERSGAFRAVVQAPTAVAADVRVTTDLIRLQQDFTNRPSRVELALRVQLVDARGRRVLATRTFDESEAAATDDAYGGVAAANAALARVLAQVVEFCIAETAEVSASTSPAR